MGEVTYRDGVAILQIIVFAPCLIAAVFLCFRHGLSKAGGSLLLVSFTLTRIAGASCQLASIDHPSTGLITAELVCLYIGLSPLTLLCWGILGRVNELVRRQIPNIVYRVTGIVSIVGLALGIYGAVKASNSFKSDPATWNAYSKAAVIIFTVVFLITVFGYFYLLTQYHSAPSVERRVFPAVLICIPLIAVRLAYALVGEWSGQIKWNPYFGNTTLYLCLAVIEECLAVVTLVLVGLTLPSYRVTHRGLDDYEKGSPNGSDISGRRRWPRESLRR